MISLIKHEILKDVVFKSRIFSQFLQTNVEAKLVKNICAEAEIVNRIFCNPFTGWAWLIRTHSLTTFFFEIGRIQINHALDDRVWQRFGRKFCPKNLMKWNLELTMFDLSVPNLYCFFQTEHFAFKEQGG